MVNGQKISPEYRFKDGDLMQHRIHRHEPPVVETLPDIVDVSKARNEKGLPVEINGFVVEGRGIPDQLVMVNKPSSVPVGIKMDERLHVRN